MQRKLSKSKALILGNIMPTKNRNNPDQGRVYDMNHIAPCITNTSGGVEDNRSSWSKKINVIGQMDNMSDHTLEMANRVYGTDGLCPTISTMQGGGRQPKILTKE